MGFDIFGRECRDLGGGERVGDGLDGAATELNGCILRLRKI